MREILFRGKTSNGKWVHGSLIYVKREYNLFCCILESEDSGRYDFPYLDSDLGIIDGQAIPVDFKTIGQYTGLIDKHGKKIFEGDILKGKYGLHRVLFDTSLAEFEWARIGGNWTESFSGFADEYEIIGNIYDNPKLLKGE